MNRLMGALSRQQIFAMKDAGMITWVVGEKQVSPSSLDLTLSEEIYRMDGVFSPRSGESVKNLIRNLRATQHNLAFPLERGVLYLARLRQEFKLPKNVYSFCNPKSTTGRNDLHVRVMADGVMNFDALAPEGFTGEAWALITPKSFPVIVPDGEPVCQARFFFSDTRLSEFELETMFAEHMLIWSLDGNPYRYEELAMSYGDGSVVLTLDLSQKVVGYVCRGTNRVLDFSKGKGSHNLYDFFEPIPKPKDEYLHLRQGCFYILSTVEAVRVPPCLACEMVDMDSRNGEFRAHYAGYIDPGWGYGEEGEGKGRPLTLEVRPFEDLFIRHNQPIARIRFERMNEIPDLHYDSGSRGSNYVVQTGPKPSKHFRV